MPRTYLSVWARASSDGGEGAAGVSEVRSRRAQPSQPAQWGERTRPLPLADPAALADDGNHAIVLGARAARDLVGRALHAEDLVAVRAAEPAEVGRRQQERAQEAGPLALVAGGRGGGGRGHGGGGGSGRRFGCRVRELGRGREEKRAALVVAVEVEQDGTRSRLVDECQGDRGDRGGRGRRRGSSISPSAGVRLPDRAQLQERRPPIARLARPLASASTHDRPRHLTLVLLSLIRRMDPTHNQSPPLRALAALSPSDLSALPAAFLCAWLPATELIDLSARSTQGVPPLAPQGRAPRPPERLHPLPGPPGAGAR